MTDPMTPTRPSEPAVNEAAERLREAIIEHKEPETAAELILLTNALNTERRNIVKRIRARLLSDHAASLLHFHFEKAWYDKSTVHTILDEVAS